MGATAACACGGRPATEHEASGEALSLILEDVGSLPVIPTPLGAKDNGAPGTEGEPPAALGSKPEEPTMPPAKCAAEGGPGREDSDARSAASFSRKFHSSPDSPKLKRNASFFASQRSRARKQTTSLVLGGRARSRMPTMSVALRSGLGLPADILEEGASDSEEASESEEVVVEEVAPQLKSTRQWNTLMRVKDAFLRLKKAASTGIPPTLREMERGIHVESIYDFYNPETKTIRQRPIRGDVLHVRTTMKAAPGEPEGSDEVSLGPAVGESGVGSNRSSDSLSSASSRQSFKAFAKDHKYHEHLSKHEVNNVEALARWGFFVAKALKERVLDFKAAGEAAARERRTAAGKQQTAKVGRLLNSIRQRAGAVVSQARKIATRIQGEKHDCLDGEWHTKKLMVTLFGAEYFDTLVLVAKAAQKLIAVQPTVVDVPAPCRIFGDTHGQLRDVLLLFSAFGSPDDKHAPAFVFNGDFVDRGAHQLELIGVLLALKVFLPEKVYLVRGNHEDRQMNVRYGFEEACFEGVGEKRGKTLFDAFQKCFEYLPMAAVVNHQILVVHGGIGPGGWTIPQLRAVRRPLDGNALADPNHAFLNHILWSDPIEDDTSGAEALFGAHPSPRGAIASKFAWNVTQTFCAANSLSLIVRSHQSKRDSLSVDVMHDRLLMRVFSARDYDGHGNDGAVLMVSPLDDVPCVKCGRAVTAATRKCPGCKAVLNVHKLGVLGVRVQVVRSATKAREEAHYHARAGELAGGLTVSERRRSLAGDRIARRHMERIEAAQQRNLMKDA